MIHYLSGDIFTTSAETIVNTVNTDGVMGKGIALAAKNQYPEMYEKYRSLCENGLLDVGKLWIWRGSPDHNILCFPTKKHWRNKSQIEWIEQGLIKFTKIYQQKRVGSTAFTKLGCGNGGLRWQDVGPIMEKYLSPLDIDCYVYLNQGVDAQPIHKVKNRDAMMNSFSKREKDFSFEEILKIFQQNVLFPEIIKYEHNEWHYQWNDGLEFVNKTTEEKHSLSEYQLEQIWNSYMKNPFINKSDSVPEALFEEVLWLKGYSHRIKFLNRDETEISDGFQMDLGAWRIFQYNHGART